MKDKVKKYLTNNEEKQLWEELYDAFQENGKENLEEKIKTQKQEIINKFNELKKKIENKLEG